MYYNKLLVQAKLHTYSFSFNVCRLAESERRYHSRESRQEDLEAIRDLRVKLREQEQMMKELVVSGELVRVAYGNNNCNTLNFQAL